jgi:cysteine synthase
MKDRMALAVISRAEEEVRLRPGTKVVTLTIDSGLKYVRTGVYRGR